MDLLQHLGDLAWFWREPSSKCQAQRCYIEGSRAQQESSRTAKVLEEDLPVFMTWQVTELKPVPDRCLIVCSHLTELFQHQLYSNRCGKLLRLLQFAVYLLVVLGALAHCSMYPLPGLVTFKLLVSCGFRNRRAETKLARLPQPRQRWAP